MVEHGFVADLYLDTTDWILLRIAPQDSAELAGDRFWLSCARDFRAIGQRRDRVSCGDQMSGPGGSCS